METPLEIRTNMKNGKYFLSATMNGEKIEMEGKINPYYLKIAENVMKLKESISDLIVFTND